MTAAPHYEAKLTGFGIFGMLRYGKLNIYATYFPHMIVGEGRICSGTKIGFGYLVHKSVYVNFDTMGIKGDEIENAPENFTNYTFAHNLMTLSVSVPLSFQ
ncbi:hypothetical protein [Bdellovibrio sp. GT3]|uniref:hypothetical protein n=1 Tax=Bdellovibrio sp. GT3 TaxID=3136282 RepID=UPI0030EFAD93